MELEKKNINSKEVEELLIKNFNDISWVSIEKQGTTLNINVAEILDNKEVFSDNTPTNIISTKDALIYYIHTNSGTPLVKANDTVKKGDILVSGEILTIEDENGKQFRHVNSDAEILGKLYYDINFFVPFRYTEKEYTGNTKVKMRLFFNNLKLNLSFVRKLYDNYDIIKENHQLKFGDNFPTPIVFSKSIYKETTIINKTRTLDEAMSYANEIINNKIISDFNFSTDIIDKNINYEEKDDGISVFATITTIENITKEEKLVIKNNLDFELD